VSRRWFEGKRNVAGMQHVVHSGHSLEQIGAGLTGEKHTRVVHLFAPRASWGWSMPTIAAPAANATASALRTCGLL
jgi:hypothetical protein